MKNVSDETANKEKLEGQLLKKVSESTSELTGEEFITELPKRITNMLGMRYCFIAECANEDNSLLRTIVFVEGEKVLDNFEYTRSFRCSLVLVLKFAAARGSVHC